MRRIHTPIAPAKAEPVFLLLLLREILLIWIAFLQEDEGSLEFANSVGKQFQQWLHDGAVCFAVVPGCLRVCDGEEMKRKPVCLLVVGVCVWEKKTESLAPRLKFWRFDFT